MARRLIAAPAAYATALLPQNPAASTPGVPGQTSSGLTAGGLVRN
jgi:hypothetical protein